MKRFFLLLVVSTTAVLAKAQEQLVVDANAEVRTVSGSFSSIKVSGGIDLYLSQSNDEAIAVSASEDRFKQSIKTTVENGILKIRYDGDKLWAMIRNKKLKVYVSFKNIDRLDVSGASDIIVAGTIAVNTLNLHVSGASEFKGAVKVNDLQLDLSGASDITISGTATTVNISSSGASDIKGDDLKTDVCSANASGASDINITVNKELNVHASGASKITYSGDALIKEMRTSGSSTVSKRS